VFPTSWLIKTNTSIASSYYRVGKTCVRKALKRAAFDPRQPSTCGVESDSVSVARRRRSTEREPVDELSVVCEDVMECSEVVGERASEEKRMLAQIIAAVFQQPPDQQEEHLARLAAAGIGKSMLDTLRQRLVGTTQSEDANITAPPSDTRQLPISDACAPAVGSPPPHHDGVSPTALQLSAVTSRPSDAELDKLIQECLDDPDSQLKLTLSMWDFGGQKLFLSMHQLFLTHNGVYLVVFNTQELLLAEGEEMVCGRRVNATTRETCLRYLREWLNSIFIFAPDAPVFIVGTCLDQIQKMDDPVHAIAEVCDLIHEVLLLSPCHEQVVYDDRPSDCINNCCFLLSNYKEDGSAEDPSVAVLRKKVRERARDQPHVHETASLHWLRALDRVSSDAAADGPARIARQEFVDRAREAGLGYDPDVPLEVEVDALLSKFHDLGLLLWYVDSPLRGN
jgi:GTPase SAR1 family protein